MLALSGLKRLALDHNHITILPPAMGHLHNLRKLKLHSNDVKSPPREVLCFPRERELFVNNLLVRVLHID